MKQRDTRNLFLAIALSVLVMAAWQYFYAGPQYQREHQAQMQAASQAAAKAGKSPPRSRAPRSSPARRRPPGGLGARRPPAPGAAPSASHRRGARGQPPHPIDTPSLGGSIDLKGGRLDDLVLKDYRETIDKKSPLIRLFSPGGAPDAYWAETGFVSAGGVKTPNRDTVWTADVKTLTADQPVTLTWDNGAGLVFKRVIAVDDKFMFTIKDSVANSGAAPASLQSLRARPAARQAERRRLFGAARGLCRRIRRRRRAGSDLRGARQGHGPRASTFNGRAAGSGLPTNTGRPPSSRNRRRRSTPASLDQRSHAAGRLSGRLPRHGKAVDPGARPETTTRVFAGAKVVSTIDGYQAKLGIKKFDLMIDWGWFYFITKPLFRLIDAIYQLVGNFGIAILIVTVLVKLAFFPLANRSYQSMAKMKKIQPQIAALKDLYPDDKVKQQQEQMALFKREGVNPGRRLPADGDPDPGVLRALQGDLHHHRDAARAVLRLDPRSLGARSRPTSSPCSASSRGTRPRCRWSATSWRSASGR